MRRAHDTDNGFDLCAAEDALVCPGEHKLVKTGVHLQLPDGHVGFVKDRSGLASRCGITTMAGVIDTGYRGEVGVVLYNTGAEAFRVAVGDRIAQLVVLKCLTDAEEVQTLEELGSTDRGAAGYGSTGS